MNIKRFIVNSILSLVLVNAMFLMVAVFRGMPFQFNVLYGLIVPIVAGFASGLALTPEERANHL